MLALAMLAGCSSGNDLDGTSWKLVGWTVSSLYPGEFDITATFSDGRISGGSGVNSYSGSYAASGGGAFEVGEIAGTLMGGSEPAMRAETIYLTLLGEARSFTLSEGTLTLYDEGGNESLIFESAGG